MKEVFGSCPSGFPGQPESPRKTIFVVDDSDRAAKTALDGSYRTFALPSAARMFKLTERITPDLILLDVDMPDMDGFEAMCRLKSDCRLKTIPVIFLTAKHDSESEIRGFEMGALDFINKPFSAPVFIKRIETHIETDALIKRSQRAVHEIYGATLNVIADMVERRDKVTGGHIERTQQYLRLLLGELRKAGTYAAETAGWDMDLVLTSAQLHDLGKIAVSDLILNKPGKLTYSEFETIKGHCAEGERMIDSIIRKTHDGGFLHHAKKFAGTHHEKWDGSGYPRGLSGGSIPLEGRIMAIADVYDALVSERPYKKPFTHERAVELIRGGSGTHFDPAIVSAFLNVADDFWVESMCM